MQSTQQCSVEECEQPLLARGLCGMHYRRQQRTGTVGGANPRRGPRLEGSCEVDSCDRPYKANGYCALHYNRVLTTGDPGAALAIRQPRGTCAFVGCERGARSGGWCGSHYAQQRRGQEVAALRYEWAKDEGCRFCGGAIPEGSGSRRFCSARCEAIYRTHDGDRPTAKQCDRCHGEIDLMATNGGGRYKRSDARMCEPCRRARSTRHGWSVAAIVMIHESTDCGICGEAVDLSLLHPHPRSASIDHIFPFARGGSNDPENLQLSHLRCNHIKNDRTPEEMALA